MSSLIIVFHMHKYLFTHKQRNIKCQQNGPMLKTQFKPYSNILIVSDRFSQVLCQVWGGIYTILLIWAFWRCWSKVFVTNGIGRFPVPVAHNRSRWRPAKKSTVKNLLWITTSTIEHKKMMVGKREYCFPPSPQKIVLLLANSGTHVME
jgi:hypothetical protein